MKKKTIVVISVCFLIVLLIGSALLFSYSKFGTFNIISAANGYYRVVNTNAQAVMIQTDPKIIIADPDESLLDRYMETLGYERVEDKQLGSLYVFSNGTDEQHIIYSQNKYYSLWEWQK